MRMPAVEGMHKLPAVVLSVIAALGAGLTMSAWGPSEGGIAAAKGTLSGSLDVTTGSTHLRPTHSVVVELVAGRKVIAKDRVAPDATFHFTAVPGHYRLNVSSTTTCRGSATVRAHRRSASTITCPLLRALWSLAFATLPIAGAITTKADALKRSASFAIERGTTRIDAVETTLKAYYTDLLVTQPLPSPFVLEATHETLTSPVWVVCQSGGTYPNQGWISTLSSTCSEWKPTGEDQESFGNERGWPSGFTRLPVLSDGS